MFLDELVKNVCEENGGVIRLVLGDGYMMTFEDALHGLAAVEKFCMQWSEFVRQNHIACGQRIGVHRGDLNIFRSCLYSEAANMASGLRDIGLERGKAVALISGKVRDEVVGTGWEHELCRVEEDKVPPEGLRIF